MNDAVRTDIYCPVSPTPELPLSLHPPLQHALPPVIYHVHCARLPETADSQPLIDFLATHTGLSSSLLRELSAFGALYARIGVRRAHERPGALRVRTIDTVTLTAAAPLYARIYASPKRHRARGTLAILCDRAPLLIVHKPAGLPVAAGADNAVECVTALLDVCVTHRLDIGTCGVLALARPGGAPAVNAALKSAEKRYRVLTRARPPCGELRHWHGRAGRGRGIVRERLLAPDAHDPPGGKGWARAVLVVLEVREILVQGTAAWESDVRLITGRTHQIRLQFAAVGCAVWGDVKYLPVDGRVLVAHANALELGPDPEVLGLCAAKLEMEWDGERMVFKSKEPWWRE